MEKGVGLGVGRGVEEEEEEEDDDGDGGERRGEVMTEEKSVYLGG